MAPSPPSTESPAASAAETRKATARIPQLDGLRAIAILLVLVWHYYVIQVAFAHDSSGLLAWFNRALGLTWSGVDLFFVLSGFLIGGILLDHRDSPRYYATFYMRRACRILPIYVLFILPLLILPMIEFPDRLQTVATALKQPFSPWLYPVFLQNFGMVLANRFAPYSGVTWSLAVEEQFYLILPFVIRLVRPKRLPVFLVSAAVSSLLLRCAAVWWFQGRAMMVCYVLLPSRCDSLLMGVLAAWAVRHRGSREWLQRRKAWLGGTLFLLALGFFGLSFTQGLGTPLINSLGFTAIAAFYVVALLWAVTNPEGVLARVLSGKVLTPIATVSYAVYLIHNPVANTLHQIVFSQKPRLSNWNEAALQLCALALTFGIAALSWRFLESKIIRFGHRFRF